MSTVYSNNITDLTRKALRNGGYEDDSLELIKADVISVGQESHHLVVLAHFEEGNGRVYLELDSHDQWIAEY
jgi:hypothetical protein